MLIHWDQSILFPYIYLQFRRECFDVQKMKKNLIIRLEHFPKINPTSNGGQILFLTICFDFTKPLKTNVSCCVGEKWCIWAGIGKSQLRNAARRETGMQSVAMCTRSAERGREGEGEPKVKVLPSEKVLTAPPSALWLCNACSCIACMPPDITVHCNNVRQDSAT